MSTRNRPSQTESASPIDRHTATSTSTDGVGTERSPTAAGAAPATFSSRNTRRLENLIDEWNAAFPGSGGTNE